MLGAVRNNSSGEHIPRDSLQVTEVSRDMTNEVNPHAPQREVQNKLSGCIPQGSSCLVGSPRLRGVPWQCVWEGGTYCEFQSSTSTLVEGILYLKMLESSYFYFKNSESSSISKL